jgi:single-stranded-DNA-specific exonuclease
MELKRLDKKSIYALLYARFNGEFLTLKEFPSPLVFKDMQKAISRVAQAILSHEKIVIVGDYDVDGVVSTTLMRYFFDSINYNIEWIIPNRFKDGYGLSPLIIQRVDADLIITVDNGIAAKEAALLCKEKGIDLIITDHHNVPLEAPEAFATINQKQKDCPFPFKEICGAQIAWYFIVALAKELQIKIDAKYLLGFVALAIVADIMPLTSINRVMLIAGLQQLQRGAYPFVEALKEKGYFKQFNAEAIAFYIAPLLNSAGRLEDASLASDFLLAKTKEEALVFLEELIVLNNQRKAIEANLSKEAMEQVEPNDKIALVWGKDWHEGVVGIVASRLANHYKMPALVLSQKNGICKGSGRSFGDCNLFDLVSKAKEYFEKFGGHKSALGLSFKEENIEKIKEILNQNAHLFIDKEFVDETILGILPFSEIDLELLELLEKFEPYGEANPKPKFITKNVEVVAIYEIGQNKEHKKFLLKESNSVVTALEFRAKSEVKVGDKVDITYTLSKNEFNGNVSVNLYLEEIAPSKE